MTRYTAPPDETNEPNPVAERIAWLDLQYTHGIHSKIGERCVAAGHITCPREYARTLDPFSGFGNIVKEVEIGRFGADMDDGACYPTIAAAIIPVGSHMAELFTAYKHVILTAISLYYFPWLKDDRGEARERGKAFCHRLDFSGTDYGFNITLGCPLAVQGTKTQTC